MKYMSRLSNWIIATAVLVLGSTANPTLAADLPKACSLLSQAEAAAALGEPIQEVSPYDSDAVSHCGFDPGVDDGAFLTLDISPNDGSGAVTWSRIRPPADGGDDLTRISTIAGLGDDAYLVSSGPVGSLNVLKGNLIIGFGIKIGTPDDAAQRLPDLARTVVSRLP